MDTAVAVGACVKHPDFGRGEVIGLSERKKAVRIRFETAGVKELPYPCPGLEPGASGEGEVGGGVLRVHLENMPGKGPGCRWLLDFKGAPVVSLVNNITSWANSKAKLNGASVSVSPVNSHQMELRISGQGRDGRCRWCKTFRSGLKTAVCRGFGSGAFSLDGACVFDQARAAGPREKRGMS